MSLANVQRTWETLGRKDPFWAVLTIRRFKHNRWDPEAFFEHGRREIRAVMDYVGRLGLDLKPGRALDFGCGVGRLTQSLGDHFQEVVGLDISEPMVELARQHNRHGGRCRYVVNTRDDLELFEDDSFDFIYSNITLQHIPPEHSVNYVAEFFRILRPGGAVIFQLPAACAVAEGTWSGRWRRFRLRCLVPIKKRWKMLRGIPVIESYPVPRATVEQLILSGGAELVDTVEDTAVDSPPFATAGKRWQSFRYCAVKRAREGRKAA